MWEPHRDDWQFLLNGRSLSDFGSRGQQRTAILALKMAEINWMTRQTGETPILLLDEVVAELDAQRRALLLDYVKMPIKPCSRPQTRPCLAGIFTKCHRFPCRERSGTIRQQSELKMPDHFQERQTL
ncbi:MAG: hypothetical protein M5U34_32160 [Chloroflexi bacterium]|nr:hypothetical protein [Chloroflexota bacterium]